MAKKEERIFIGFINPEGDSCPVPYGKCNSLCDNCQGGMTRQEAINRIAKAIWEAGYKEVLNISFDKLKKEGHKSKSKTFGNFYKLTMTRAEAALNALLEETK